MLKINPWFLFSLLFLLLWAVIFLLKSSLRKEMLWGSILTAPFGLTEPLFVPEYWNPPSLFNLAAKTGFDIESIIFCFSIGGIGVILYEFFFKVKHKKISKHEKHNRKHKFHLFVLISPIIAFLILSLIKLNPIYSASIAMFIGGITTLYCRADLKKKIVVGGLLFLGLYFLFFLIFNITYPEIVLEIWNLKAISGILILRIPLEELMFAFTFGMLWSSYYEHINWYKLERKTLNSHMYNISI